MQVSEFIADHFWPLAGLGAGLVFAVIFIGLASGASLVSIRVLVVKVEMRWPRSGPGHSATTAAPEDEKERESPVDGSLSDR